MPNDPALPEGSRLFRAADARTALAAVKEAFGADAVIVTTRQIPGGLFRKNLVEVVALPASALASIRSGGKGASRPPETKGAGGSATAWTPREVGEPTAPQTTRTTPPLLREPVSLIEEARQAPLSAPAPSRQSRVRRYQVASPESAAEPAPPPPPAPIVTPPALPALAEPRLPAVERAPAATVPVAAELDDENAAETPPPPRGEVSEAPVSRRRAPAAAVRKGRPWRRGGPADKLFQRYVEHGIETSHAGELLQQAVASGAQDERGIDLEVRRLAALQLVTTTPPWSNPGGRQVVALAGPTGVGKTTTLAKLAARALLDSRLKVALVTIDTYRICASDQLARYGEIMRAPTYIARDASQLGAALRGTLDCDLVLVDTAGRSIQQEIDNQTELLRTAPDVHMYLTLSLSSGTREMSANLKRFDGIRAERLILTKMDEAVAPGAIFGPLVRSGKPVTCITNGQEVPEHVQSVTPAQLADILFGPPPDGAAARSSIGRA